MYYYIYVKTAATKINNISLINVKKNKFTIFFSLLIAKTANLKMVCRFLVELDAVQVIVVERRGVPRLTVRCNACPNI